jgi:hypothetical protein
MPAEHSTVGIEIGDYFKGHAEGPLGIAALVVIVLILVLKWRGHSP